MTATDAGNAFDGANSVRCWRLKKRTVNMEQQNIIRFSHFVDARNDFMATPGDGSRRKR
jgi:hypothetical protein